MYISATFMVTDVEDTEIYVDLRYARMKVLHIYRY